MIIKNRIYERDVKEKIAYRKNKCLSSIYKSILWIERNYTLTTGYMESSHLIDENDSKYRNVCKELDKVRTVCDLFFYKELSKEINDLDSSLNIYWGDLDYYIRHKNSGNHAQEQENLDKASYKATEIQEQVRNIKEKIRVIVSTGKY